MTKLLSVVLLPATVVLASGWAQAFPEAPGQVTTCGTTFHMQVEARSDSNKPLAGLRAGDLQAENQNKPLKILSIRPLIADSAENSTTSLLVVVWPQAQIDGEGVEELLKALRAEEKINWRVGVVSPSVKPLQWRSLDALQEPLEEAAEAAAKLHLGGLQVRGQSALKQISATRWGMVVRGTAEALLSQPGRHVILEIAPKPNPRFFTAAPGEAQLNASASFGSSPVYLLTEVGSLNSALSIPFGDASTGPPFIPDHNPTLSEQNSSLLQGVEDASEIDSFRPIQPSPSNLSGGTNLSSPKTIIHRIATDTAGSYSVIAETPRGCDARALYTLTFTSTKSPGKIHLYGPRSFYYPLSHKHP